MLGALTTLLVFQLVGEAIVMLSGLPVPGPVVGMLLLFIALMVRGRSPEPLRDTSGRILSHLSLLFVPAGVGVMVHLDRLAAEALPLAASLVASTVLTIAVSALVMRALQK